MGSSSLQSRQLGRKLYKQWGAEKVIDKKDREDVNRKSSCKGVTKQWLNVCTKVNIRYTSSSRDGALSSYSGHASCFIELTTTNNLIVMISAKTTLVCSIIVCNSIQS